MLFGSAAGQSIQFLFILSKVIEIHYAEQNVLQIFFTWPLFWLLLLIQVPLITMRVFSEELKLGTIEMLLTAPVNDWDVVIAKFLGSLTFFMVLCEPDCPRSRRLAALLQSSSPLSIGARFY